MRRTLLLLVTISALIPNVVSIFAQEAGKQVLPAAARLTSAVCGTGTYLLSLGVQPLGRETFEIKCGGSDGFSANGKTKMDIPGAAMELNTTIDTDLSGLPIRFSVKGSGRGQTIDQLVTINKEIATVVNAGQTSEVSYRGGALFHPNITFTYQFLLARYDVEKGGPQNIAVFPSGEVTLERTARDKVQPSGIAATTPVPFDRFSLQLGPATLALWTDDRGRLVALHAPAQNVMVVREDYQAFAHPLRAALLASVKGLAPDYSAAPGAAFTAEEVKIEGKDLTLAGTLLLPKNAKGRVPAVITSTGSGQQTRDSTLNLPGLEAYRPFRQIAEAIAGRGIAVLRADDRGVGDSTGLATLGAATTLDFANDVRAQIAYLRSRPDIDPDRIGIIGHSEGGIIAPLVAESDRRVRAIVLMAGTAKRGEEVLRYQLNYPSDSDTKLSDEERDKKRQENEEALRALMTGADVSKYPMIVRMLAAPWTRWFMQHDPLATIKKVRQPILIVQGGLDQQVTADQATMLSEAAKAAGNKDVTVRVFPDLNHLFLSAKTGAASEYGSLSTSMIGDDVLTAIADWLELKLHKGK